MDDIRRPQHLKRRDYSVPVSRPEPLGPSDPPATAHHPKPHSATNPPYNPSHATHPQHPQHHQPHHQEQPRPQVAHTVQAPPQKRSRIGKKLSITVAIIIAAAAIFGAGYLLKGSNDGANGIPVTITRQVNYDLYFPSPMPSGYTYMKDTATFQIGQVFYKFANGKKRVTVNEQPITDPKPDINALTGYAQFDTPVGKAAIGRDIGEPTVVVITPTTVITMHSVGGVSPGDLKTAANNLKNIGQKPNQ